MNPVDLRELKISRHNEILTPNHSFYFRPLCAIFSISEPPARTKKATNLLFVSRSNKKNRFARIEPSWFLTWRFLSSPILEICIFFLPILSSGFWLSVTSSFVGGLPASFKLTSSDWGVVRCRSVKWTDSNNKVSSLNHKQVPATSLDTVKGRNAIIAALEFSEENLRKWTFFFFAFFYRKYGKTGLGLEELNPNVHLIWNSRKYPYLPCGLGCWKI